VSANNGGAPICTPAAVCLLGADSSGANVFFATNDKLVGRDTDTELDYYDARICSASDPCIKQTAENNVVCEGDACQGARTPQPPLLSAASISFAGPGNAAPPGSPPAPGKVKVLGHAVHGTTFTISVKVPAKGRISIASAGIATLRRSVTSAGTYRFALSLTRKARSSMRRHHRHKLKLHLRVTYAPASGSPSFASVSVTVKV
jgi:hypothetical protein